MSKINKICILGGGTAGFSTACLLARYKELSKIDLDITVYIQVTLAILE